MSIWIIFLVSLFCYSVGFLTYSYFSSLGYGLAIAGIGLTLFFGFSSRIGAAEIIACFLLVIYGLQLCSHILFRKKNHIPESEPDQTSSMKLIPKCAHWIGSSLVCVLKTCPLFFRLNNGVPAGFMLWLGIIVMLIGIIVVFVANLQKSIFNSKFPEDFDDTGINQLVRYPGYLGEIILWLGVFLAGLTGLRGIFQWMFTILSFAIVVYLTFRNVQRLEEYQHDKHRKDPDYQRYVHTVPVLIPFVSLYSLRKCRFLWS